VTEPYIPFEDCAEVVMNGMTGGSQTVWTLGVKKTSTLSDGDLPDIYDVFDFWWTNHMRGSVGDDFSLLTIRVTNLTTQFSGVYETSPTGDPLGAVTGTIAPNNAAMVISLKTANRGRSYRGRNYIPAVPSSFLQDANHITTTAAEDLQEAYELLATQLAAANYLHVVLSRQENGVRRTVGVATPVITYIGKTRIGTMRRRVVGAVPNLVKLVGGVVSLGENLHTCG